MANRAQRRQSSSGLPGKTVQIRTAPKSAGVVIAYPHPVGEVNARFHTSLIDLLQYDSRGAVTPEGEEVGGKLHVMGHMPMSSGANIVTARNKIVKAFLDQSWGFDAQWLFFIDSDMTFNANALDMLLAVADKDERPIVGGLCFALMKGDAQEVVATAYGISTQDNQLVRYSGYPQDQLFQVAGTGAAFLLVHRSVFETIRDRRWTADDEERFRIQSNGAPSGRALGTLLYPPPWPWFQETITGNNWGDALSEDLTFCLRAGQCGFPIWVDSRVKTGHVKPIVIDEQSYLAGLPGEEEPAPTYVTIPVKGQHHFTKGLLAQLREQGGYDHIFLFDNGADDDPVPEELWKGLDDITYFDASGYRFYRMWNDGIRYSLARQSRCNIVILNNDLELGPDFLHELTKGLRVHPMFASVCGNYDGRDFPEVVQGVRGIAAGKEDGTGGWAGFGFAIRGEYLASGLPMFDDDSYHLWYGDNDWLLQVEAAGVTYGIVKNAHMIHLGGGSNTSGDGNGHRLAPEWHDRVEQDRKRFEEKWHTEVAG